MQTAIFAVFPLYGDRLFDLYGLLRAGMPTVPVFKQPPSLHSCVVRVAAVVHRRRLCPAASPFRLYVISLMCVRIPLPVPAVYANDPHLTVASLFSLKFVTLPLRWRPNSCCFPSLLIFPLRLASVPPASMLAQCRLFRMNGCGPVSRVLCFRSFMLPLRIPS